MSMLKRHHSLLFKIGLWFILLVNFQFSDGCYYMFVGLHYRHILLHFKVSSFFLVIILTICTLENSSFDSIGFLISLFCCCEMFFQAKSLDCNCKPRTLPQKPQTQLLKSSAQCIYEIAHFDNWDCQFPPPLMLFTSFTANKIKPGPFQVSATATTRTSAIFPLFLKTFILKWMVHGLQLAPPWPRRQRGDVVGDIEAPQGIDRGGHESTDLDFISTTKIMSILMVCSSQFLAFLLTFNLVEFFILWVWKFKVSTIVQVVGIILSLHAATKISSRAQGIATFACRWHALMTCSSNDSPHKRSSDSLVNFEAANRLSSLHTSYSDSDLESTDYVHVPTNSQLASHRASYHK
ncbi:uncharacterized protein LOC103955333 isoform X2 [Pyrus x bretschneideri]|uniref:uncharacterized protein LOC103955333 isoform X2 n=1 Tax=Pyrus x bretschneideri TaxID=225117 RepID=UPI00202E9591|nr:uncharacterized protein LOC103955333 isoform X2 [Pyrus x bretschneideri]XP_048447935.1 uncharacterized protein LOC103955333 isoform X2 [Pyrus x bretschneideri]XP_048447936.1 uncharacterized protein LOC103955333 isoform X2 [Pyrus x bretschneideri]XP_048447937.1 uncharacterized protein LOC103955333 isoform X2 [Pyrus x bretschneideri]XP_048447938.1 uncharacterized protein LOC103955333 isoform X2 [Pyrus x bretschneideri]XP_048447939.1 uncharacterized protein LOC103955333 isoform X2 [Pyrus x bre